MNTVIVPEDIKTEMLKIKVPWLVKFADKFWFKAGRYIMFFGLLSFFPIGIIKNANTNMHTGMILSYIAIILFAFLLVGLGGLMLVNHFVKNNFVKKHAKRLDITLDEWNKYAEFLKLYTF